MRTDKIHRHRLATISAIGALAIAALTGCAADPVGAVPVNTVTIGGSSPVTPVEDVAPQATASAADVSPSPSAPDEAPRAMQVGDCLNKIAVDDLGLPMPEFIDCADPHMFEVTAIVEASKAGATYNSDVIDDARKARCRAEYESYTGRDARAMGNAFGWDQLSEEAWDAGVTGFPCYATAPGFANLTGSVAR